VTIAFAHDFDIWKGRLFILGNCLEGYACGI
jgi:hypothetical protein